MYSDLSAELAIELPKHGLIRTFEVPTHLEKTLKY